MWFSRSYRRNLVDMHIPDWDERFLSELDPAKYAELIARSNTDTALVYTSSCLGLANWPTQAGNRHAGTKGDFIGEVFAELRKRGVRPIVYCNNWSLWAYDNHPDWRVIDAKGRGTAEWLWNPGHYGVVCQNSPYKQWNIEQVQEICRRYDFEGIWFDMNMWPYTPCYCRHCATRYEEEVGGQMPRIVDWNDPVWVNFQRKREEWLTEYTHDLRQAVLDIKPDATVGYQAAMWSSGWTAGTDAGFYQQSEYLSGDFYGGFESQSFICKILDKLTPQRPFEYSSSRCPDLEEHTTNKSAEQLLTQVYLTLAHNGAFFFIDAIDPVGTMDDRVYDMMGSIYGESRAYEKSLDPSLEVAADVAVYFNWESLMNPSDNGKFVLDANEAPVGVADMEWMSVTLQRAHVPHTFITRKDLAPFVERSRNELCTGVAKAVGFDSAQPAASAASYRSNGGITISNQGFKVLVLPDFVSLTASDAQAIEGFVEAGGGLLVTGGAMSLGPTANPEARAILEALLGIQRTGETEPGTHYVAPTQAGQPLFPDHSEKYPLALNGKHAIVTNTGAEVLATIGLPYSDPGNPSRFSSAISNPPSESTDIPAVTVRQCGKGKAIFVSGLLERTKYDPQRDAFCRLLEHLTPGGFSITTNAPKSVQIVPLKSPDGKRILVSLINCPDLLPAAPVGNIEVTVDAGSQSPVKLTMLPDQTPVDFTQEGSRISFTVTDLEVFGMVEIVVG